MEQEIKKILKETNKKYWIRVIFKNLEYKTFFKDMYPGIELKEAIFLFEKGLNSPPSCPICNTKIKLTGVIYKETCSRKCAEELKKRTGKKELELEKAKLTNLKKYGVENPTKNKKVQEKRISTMIDRYGDKISPKHKEILSLSKSQAYETRSKKLINEYGIGNISSLPAAKVNRKNTFLERYGVEHYHQSEEFKNKLNQNKKEKIELNNSDIEVVSFENIDNYKTGGIRYKCKKCSSEEVIPLVTFNYRSINFNTPCSHCGDFNKPWSNGEKDLLTEIQTFYFGEIITNKKIIPPYTLDIFIPEFNLAIEYNGLFWHSERGGGKDTKYHSIKTQLCRQQGIRLLHIFENEYKNSKEIVLSKIKNILGLSEKGVGARNIIIKEINSVAGNTFLNKHHIQGGVPGSKFLGGFYSNQLISVLAYKKIDQILDITRFANDFKLYPGLFSKFLSYLERNIEYDKIITFADLRWSYGDLYYKTGFTEEYTISPGYYYTDYSNLYHKFNFRKENIKKKFNIDIRGKTEKELMEELRYDRIWDSGKIKFIK